MGRPSSFRPEFVEQARKLCELGATDLELADFFEVDVRTIYRWQAQEDAFCHALKAGKVAADERVTRSLYHRACGYTQDAVRSSSIRVSLSGSPIGSTFRLTRRPRSSGSRTGVPRNGATGTITRSPARTAARSR